MRRLGWAGGGKQSTWALQGEGRHTGSAQPSTSQHPRGSASSSQWFQAKLYRNAHLHWTEHVLSGTRCRDVPQKAGRGRRVEKAPTAGHVPGTVPVPESLSICGSGPQLHPFT